jgi:uncharacterized phiE125 gp8 family phage protein
MLAPVRTVAPTEDPVTLAEAKAHVRVDHADDDSLITALIAAATNHLDGYTGILGRALITQTWRQDFAAFAPKLRLALRPVASVTSVTYFDGDNTSQTLSASIYGLFEDGAGPYIALDPDQTWPGSYRRVDGVSVTYVAGEASAEVPMGSIASGPQSGTMTTVYGFPIRMPMSHLVQATPQLRLVPPRPRYPSRLWITSVGLRILLC